MFIRNDSRKTNKMRVVSLYLYCDVSVSLFALLLEMLYSKIQGSHSKSDIKFHDFPWLYRPKKPRISITTSVKRNDVKKVLKVENWRLSSPLELFFVYMKVYTNTEAELQCKCQKWPPPLDWKPCKHKVNKIIKQATARLRLISF